MKTGILDASSAILLFKAGLYQILVDSYQIIIADSVDAELVKEGYAGADVFARNRTCHKITVLKVQEAAYQRPGSHSELLSLDRGERDTVVCFASGVGDFVITDDGRAARYCRNNGIPYINALLFPRILFFCGQLPFHLCQQTMQYLIAIGRYSREVIHFAASCSREELMPFLPETVSSKTNGERPPISSATPAI